MNRLFPNAWHVARREYLQRVRTRTFVVATVVLAVLAVVFVLAPVLIRAVAGEERTRIGLVAADADADRVETSLSIAAVGAVASGGDGEAEEPSVEIVRVTGEEAGRAQLDADQLDGVLIAERIDGELTFRWLSGESDPFDTTETLVRSAAVAAAIGDRLDREGIGPADQARLFAPPAFEVHPVGDAAAQETDTGAGLLVAYLAVVFFFLAVLTYGSWVAASVTEEKSSRVMELLITAATPRQLLTGKVLGTGAAGLSQYVVIVAAVIAGVLATGPAERALGISPSGELSFATLGLGFATVSTLLFLGGFLLYCTLYAAAGSVVSRQEDVQAAAGPLTMLAMVGYFGSFVALNALDADWVRVASMVPIFSPSLLPARMATGPVPWTEIALALALLATAVVVATWLAARIYSAGVLLYGQRPSWRAVLKAARVPR